MSTTDVGERAQAAGRALDEINRRCSTAFRMDARATGGVNDAWLLDAPGGQRAVLKLGSWRTGHLERAAAVVERLRMRGYPTPEWFAVGTLDTGATYHVQEFVKGEPIRALSGAHARLLVELVELHAGVDLWPERDWSAYVASDLEPCAEELHRTVSDARPLVRSFQQLIARLGPVEPPSGDFVHGDLHRGNVLLHNGRVRGVIDIEACGGGTRAADYAWLLRDTYTAPGADPAARRIIRRAGEAVAGLEVLAYFATFTALDTMRWRAHNAPRDLHALFDPLRRLAADLSR